MTANIFRTSLDLKNIFWGDWSNAKVEQKDDKGYRCKR